MKRAKVVVKNKNMMNTEKNRIQSENEIVADQDNGSTDNNNTRAHVNNELDNSGDIEVNKDKNYGNLLHDKNADVTSAEPADHTAEHHSEGVIEREGEGAERKVDDGLLQESVENIVPSSSSSSSSSSTSSLHKIPSLKGSKELRVRVSVLSLEIFCSCRHRTSLAGQGQVPGVRARKYEMIDAVTSFSASTC